MAPGINLLAAQKLKELRAQGAQPTDDDVVWLHSIAERMQFPKWQRSFLLAGGSITICEGIELWPLTIGAQAWYRDVAHPVLDGTDDVVFGMAFAMAHSRDLRTLNNLTGCKEVRSAVNKWQRRLSCTALELVTAVRTLSDECRVDGEFCPTCRQWVEKRADTSVRQSDDGVDTLVSFLCRSFPGTTREYWMWGESQAYALEMAGRALKETDDKAAAKLNPAVIATADMAFAVASIRKRGEGGK